VVIYWNVVIVGQLGLLHKLAFVAWTCYRASIDGRNWFIIEVAQRQVVFISNSTDPLEVGHRLL